MKKHDGGIAFGGSRIEIEEGTGIPRKIEYTGMTLREYYAGQALAGMTRSLAENATQYTDKIEKIVKLQSKLAVLSADALIAELEGGE